jgi:DNA-directed RNA polymerase beta' subunit
VDEYSGIHPSRTASFVHLGLVDTAVKTAETGYMARRLMKVGLKNVVILKNSRVSAKKSVLCSTNANDDIPMVGSGGSFHAI